MWEGNFAVRMVASKVFDIRSIESSDAELWLVVTALVDFPQELIALNYLGQVPQ